MNLDGEDIRWNPHICESTKEELAETELEEVPDYLINSNHSSETLRWDGEKFFGKEKDRKPSNTIQELTRTGEFDHKLSLYNEHHDTGVHAPTPYCAIMYSEENQIDNELIMEFMGGDDWMSFPKAFSQGEIVQEEEVQSVCQGIGEFAKILQNEKLGHGDIAWRHLYVNPDNYDIAVIDIEGGTTQARPSMMDEETREIQEILDQIPRPQYEDQINGWFEQGYNSVPDPRNTDLPTSEYACDGGYEISENALDLLS